MRYLISSRNNTTEKVQSSKKSPYQEFFKFLSSTEKSDTLKEFLETIDTNFKVLKYFPEIKKIFIEYNVCLPSSASVERVFSIAGLILAHNRMKLTDENFEKILFLKCNKKWQVYV